MATYEITTADQKVYEVDVPDGTSTSTPDPTRPLAGAILSPVGVMDRPVLGTTPRTALRSGGAYFGNMATAITHPVATAKGLGNLALGTAQLAIPGQQGKEDFATEAGRVIQERYGSFENLQQTWQRDPIGVIADVSGLLTTGGGMATTTGRAASLPRLATAGRMTAAVGRELDPIVMMVKAAKASAGMSDKVLHATTGMEAASGRALNSLIRPSNKQFSYGKNPGLTVAKEGITASGLEDLGAKIQQRRMEVGQSIGQVLKSPAVASQTLDIRNAIDPINKAIVKAQQFPQTNESVLHRLQGLRDDLLGITIDPATGQKSAATRNLTSLTPYEAFELKQAVGDLTKWTDNLADDTVVNAASKQSYDVIRNHIERVAPGVKPLNERYGGLLEAGKATERQIFHQQRRNPELFSTADYMAGMAGGVSMGGIGPGIVGVLLSKGAREALKSTPFRTHVANALNRLTPASVGSFLKSIPGLQSELTRYGLWTGTAQQRLTDAVPANTLRQTGGTSR